MSTVEQTSSSPQQLAPSVVCYLWPIVRPLSNCQGSVRCLYRGVQVAEHLESGVLRLPLLAGVGLRGQGIAQAQLHAVQRSCARLALRGQRLAALLRRGQLARQVCALDPGFLVAC